MPGACSTTASHDGRVPPGGDVPAPQSSSRAAPRLVAIGIVVALLMFVFLPATMMVGVTT